MMVVARKMVFLTFLFMSVVNLDAQSDLSSFFAFGSWQQHNINPSLSNDAGLQIALPSLYLGLSHSPNVEMDKVLFESGGRNIVSLDAVLEELNDVNDYLAGLEFRTLGIGAHFGRAFVSFQHRIHFQSLIIYPRELAQLVWNGNSQYIGQEVEFSPQAFLQSYHELGLGFNYQVSERLSLGARIKALSGVGLIKSTDSHASLYTSDDVYQLTFDIDYTLQSSSVLEINGLDEFNYSGEAITLDRFFSKNSGLGIDLGVKYQVNDRLQLAASIIDLGKITWKENTNEFKSQGIHTHEGIDLSNFFADEEIDFNVQLDTVKEIFGFEKVGVGEIRSKLPASIFLGGTYKISDQWMAGILFRNVSAEKLNDQAFSLNLQYQPFPPLAFGITYSYLNKSAANLGLMALANLGPLQIFGATDNAIAIFDPGTSINVGGRLGFSLMIK